MTQKIVIAGSGFAGFWAAVSAMRAVALAGKEQSVEVTMVSPTPNVTIRPRLYEAVLENMSPDISAQLAAIGVRHLAGLVEQIDGENKTLVVECAEGKKLQLAYDRLVLATGSKLFVPAVAGFAEHGFNVDTLQSAQRLDAHLKALATQPETRHAIPWWWSVVGLPGWKVLLKCRCAYVPFWATKPIFAW